MEKETLYSVELYDGSRLWMTYEEWVNYREPTPNSDKSINEIIRIAFEGE